MAEGARSIQQQYPNFELEVLEEDECAKMGMGAFIAVGRGSNQPSKFIHLTYKGKSSKNKIAIVGKGVCFDTGGYNIKSMASFM